MSLFKKLNMLNTIDSVFEMSLRIIACYNDNDLAKIVVKDILDSANDIVETKEQAEFYFDIILNIYDEQEVFRDPYFYKEVLDVLIEDYESLKIYYDEYIKDKNLDIPITYHALLKLISRKPDEGDD